MSIRAENCCKRIKAPRFPFDEKGNADAAGPVIYWLFKDELWKIPTDFVLDIRIIFALIILFTFSVWNDRIINRPSRRIEDIGRAWSGYLFCSNLSARSAAGHPGGYNHYRLIRLGPLFWVSWLWSWIFRVLMGKRWPGTVSLSGFPLLLLHLLSFASFRYYQAPTDNNANRRKVPKPTWPDSRQSGKVVAPMPDTKSIQITAPQQGNG